MNHYAVFYIWLWVLYLSLSHTHTQTYSFFYINLRYASNRKPFSQLPLSLLLNAAEAIFPQSKALGTDFPLHTPNAYRTVAVSAYRRMLKSTRSIIDYHFQPFQPAINESTNRPPGIRHFLAQTGPALSLGRILYLLLFCCCPFTYLTPVLQLLGTTKRLCNSFHRA